MNLKILVQVSALNKHVPWFKHPENPTRIKYILKGLEERNLSGYVEKFAVDVSEDKALHIIRRIHCKAYVDYILRQHLNAPCHLDPDTYMSKDTYELATETVYALYNAGYNIRKSDKLIYIVRPPGHHAGMCGKAFGAPTLGFCIFNNAASTVLGLLDKGYSRVAVLDFDIHHGNGTQEIFYKENKVFHVDIHRDPREFYPFTGYPEDLGAGRGKGYSANFIIQGETSDDSYLEVFEYVAKLIEEYEPDALVVSAGFDAFEGDGLADTRLSEYTYYVIGKWIRGFDAPVIAVLEGGYSMGLYKGLPALIEGITGSDAYYYPKNTPRRIASINRENAEYTYQLIKSFMDDTDE